MNQEQAYSKIEQHYRANKDKWSKRFGRYVSSPERGEDIVSEAYTRMLTYWQHAPEDDEHFEKWTRTVVNNCSKSNAKEEALRGATNSVELEDDNASVKPIPTVILNEVMAEIEVKDQPTKTALKLALLEGWKHAAIADVVGYKVQSIRKLVFAFRQQIREKYKWSI